MFGQIYYHGLIRKYVILVGTLFNDIYIRRTDSAGDVSALVKVPITFSPKDKMLARVLQDPNIDTKAAVVLPMISFELGNMVYDGARKLNTIGRTVIKSDETGKFKYQYNPVPYNFDFKVYIYSKNAEDGTKIVEQILPFFTPDWTTTVNLISETEQTVDIPIILNKINYNDNYDDDFLKRRAIVWELDLTLKGYLFGPIKKSAIIKFINVNFYIPNNVADGYLANAVGNTAISEKITIQPGLDANGNAVSYYGANTADITSATLPYTEIEEDDNWGYIVKIYDTEDLL